MPASTEVKFFHHKMNGIPKLAGPKGSVITLFNAILVDGFGERTVTGVSVSGNVATVTLANHDMKKHWVISISGATPAQLNGEHRITKSYKDTFQFETVGVADGPATGTIKIKYAPAGWKKVAQSADGFKAVYKSDRLGFEQPLFMVDDTEDRGYGFKVFAMSWFDNFESYDTSMENYFRTRFTKKAHYENVAFAFLVNDHFLYNVVDNSSDANSNKMFSDDGQYSSSAIQCFGAMKTTKANNKYNGVVGGLSNDASYFNSSNIIDTKNSASRSIISGANSLLIQRSYTSIGDPLQIGPNLPYVSGVFSGSYTYGVVNASDYAVYIQRPIISGGSVAYGYLPGVYFTPMGFKPSKAEPFFVEDVKQIQPDNLMMWVPSWSGGLYFNATKW